MKTTLKKLLCVLLSCLMLGGLAATASADEVRRVSCSMYADGATGRGFCWFTAEKSASDLQLVAKADFTSDFANAKTYTGKAQTQAAVIRLALQEIQVVEIAAVKPDIPQSGKIGEEGGVPQGVGVVVTLEMDPLQ